MNFFDLCVVCCRAIGRWCAAFGRLLGHMVRLTYRYWWIVLTVVALGIAAALYYTRPGNLKFRVNAVAMLNGPSLTQFAQALEPVKSGMLLSGDLQLGRLLAERKVRDIATFHVIDCLGDSTADYIDFRGSIAMDDTVNVPMRDRICIQFCIKHRDLGLVQTVENDILQWLNSDEAMQKAYATYLKNLQSEVEFNHTQMAKLDSLTTEYYFHAHHGNQPLTGIESGVVWVGDWRVHLFLHDIYAHQKRTEWCDQRMQLATAPVVLETHFTVDPQPINSRIKFLFLFLLLGWIGGCVLAEVVSQRKALSEWLKA